MIQTLIYTSSSQIINTSSNMASQTWDSDYFLLVHNLKDLYVLSLNKNDQDIRWIATKERLFKYMNIISKPVYTILIIQSKNYLSSFKFPELQKTFSLLSFSLHLDEYIIFKQKRAQKY